MNSDEELFALEVSESGTTLGQVYYAPGHSNQDHQDVANEDGFSVKESGTHQAVSETDFVLDTGRSEDNKTVSFTVENREGEQKFGLRGDYDDATEGGDTDLDLVDDAFYIPDTFDWGTPSSYTASFEGDLGTNLEGQQVTIPEDSSKGFILQTDFALNLETGDYTPGIEVEPDTSQDEVTDWESSDDTQS
jgi:hypothetical protein